MGLKRLTHCFTLIEVLTVIMVMAVLFSMLMPTLARTRERSRAVSCVNRMGQLSRAHMFYVKDSNFLFASAKEWVNDDGWQWYRPVRTTEGTLWEYTDETPEVYVCPTAEVRFPAHPYVKGLIASGKFEGFGWTITMNERSGNRRGWQGCRLRRFTSVVSPESLGLFADENAWTVPGFSRYKINNGALGTRKNDGITPVSGAPIDCIGTFHYTANNEFLSGRGNVGFADGHAATHWVWESELITTPKAGSCD